MRNLVRRNSVGVLALFAAGAALLWLASPTAPAAPRIADPTEEVEDPETEAREPDPLLRTGGPYVDPGQIREAALREAAAHHVTDPEIDHVLAMTYGEAVRWCRSGSSALLHSSREVYVVSVQGGVSVPASGGGTIPFARTYYVFDAPTGNLVQWGATDLPEPDEDLSARER